MRVGEICNRDVVVVYKDGSVQEAAQLMRTHHVGDLVVVEERYGQLTPVGILTDRDIVIEIVAKSVDLDAVTIKDIMSFELVTAKEDDDMLETIKLMRAKGVRRIPVVSDRGGLVGILAVDDLIDLLGEILADVAGVSLRERKRELKQRA